MMTLGEGVVELHRVTVEQEEAEGVRLPPPSSPEEAVTVGLVLGQ